MNWPSQLCSLRGVWIKNEKCASHSQVSLAGVGGRDQRGSFLASSSRWPSNGD